MIINKKTILLLVLGIFLLASIINFSTGTTIIINGKHITSPAGYVIAYVGMILLAILMVILVPSVFVLAVVLATIFLVMIVLFFPFMPLTFFISPTIVLAVIVLIVYGLIRKKKQMG